MLIYLFSFVFFLFYFFCLIFFIFCFFGSGFLFNFYLFSMSGFDFSLSFCFDYLSFGFFSCVSFISSIVFIYSNFYMGGSVDMRRFCWLVFLFVVSMGLLVFSGNFFIVMVGWDGLGLVSFCLVIFYSNSSSLDSGLITVFSNRVGDVFFLFCFFLFSCGGSWSSDSFSSFYYLPFVFFLFFGAVTKSAQVPFSAWLPAAMAAPTPVSSLVHSSTLVTAGIYILIRFNYIFFGLFVSFFKIFSIFTMVLAGFCACLEKDFKKIVAMSTLSQLGMMLFILFVGCWKFSFLHMVVHAFFKSMLFLSTGSLMGQMAGLQESRFYGGSLFSFSSFVCFSVSCFCLGGFPFFIGFYSKDLIILGSSYFYGFFYYMFFLIGCVFTIFYSFRLIWSSYLSFFKSYLFLEFSEGFFFVFPIMFLFFNGWLLGGMFYWFFLFDCFFFFSFFDVFFGLILIFLGFSCFVLFGWFYHLFLYISSILFLRWMSSGGISFSFTFDKIFRFEGGWLESLGGGGVFSFLNKTSVSFDLFKRFGFGFVFFSSFFGLCYFL